MAKYLNEVRRHCKEIQQFYENAGDLGYANALYHFTQIENLEIGAMRSVNYKEDANLIHEIRKNMRKLMDEMEQRKKPR